MVTSQIDAYVLSSYPYKNSGLVVKVLTEYGVKTIFGTNYQNIKRGNLIYEQRFVKISIDGIIDDEFLKVRSQKLLDYNEEVVLNYNINTILNLISSLILNSEDTSKYFDLFYFTMHQINKENYNKFLLIWLSYLYLNITKESTLDKCVICSNRDSIVDYNFELNGYVCKDHISLNNELSLLELKTIKKLHQFNYDEILNMKLNIKLLNLYLDYLQNSYGLNLYKLEKYVRDL